MRQRHSIGCRNKSNCAPQQRNRPHHLVPRSHAHAMCTTHQGTQLINAHHVQGTQR